MSRARIGTLTSGIGVLVVVSALQAAPSLVSVGMGSGKLAANGQGCLGLMYDSQIQQYRIAKFLRGTGTTLIPGPTLKSGPVMGSDDLGILAITSENQVNWGGINCFLGNGVADQTPPCNMSYLPYRSENGVWTPCGSFARSQQFATYANYPAGLNVWVGGTRCDASTASPNDVSGNGQIIVGGAYYASAAPRSNGNAPSGICGSFIAYSYNAATGITTPLAAQPTTGNITTRADRTNYDGSVIVGYDLGTSPDPDGEGPFTSWSGRRLAVWRNGAETLLDPYGNADSTPVTRDGNVVVGQMTYQQAALSGLNPPPNIVGILCKWTWNGSAWLPAALPLAANLPDGTPCITLRALGVSDDGNTVVGVAYYSATPDTFGAVTQGFIWRPTINGGVPIDLETYYRSLLPPGDTSLEGMSFRNPGIGSLSADGNAIMIPLGDNRNPCLYTGPNAIAYLNDTACEPARINLPPRSQAVDNVDFFGIIQNVFASGTWPLNYQWQKETAPGVWSDLVDDNCNQFQSTFFDVKGATGPQLRLGILSGFPAGTYRCVVSNACGSVASDPATVSCGSPSVNAPTSKTICEGGNISIMAQSTNIGGAVTYHWFKDSAPLLDGTTPQGSFVSGTDTDTIAISPVTMGDAGQYTYSVTSGCGATTLSAPGTLTVRTSPAITVQPGVVRSRAGESKYFQVSVNNPGSPNLLSFDFRWRKNGVPLADGPTGTGSTISGATSLSSFYGSFMYVNNATPQDAGQYDCVITGGNCANQSISQPGTFIFVCPADLDDGRGTHLADGAVTIDDLLYFLNVFEQGNVVADLDNGGGAGTPDGAVTVDDLLYFLVRFEAGC